MNGRLKQARRYHWLSEGLRSFVDEPHAAIEGPGQGEIINLTDRRAQASRRSQIEVLSTLGPDGITRELSALANHAGMRVPAAVSAQLELPHLRLPEHHDVRASDVLARRLHGGLAAAADRGPSDFSELLLTPGVGARTVRALALVAEVLHGAPCRFSDPARFSFAHGGKDRRPFPVPTKIYDRTIAVLDAALRTAKLGDTERVNGFKRLHAFTQMVEDTFDPCADLDKTIAKECAESADHGGRSICGWEQPPTQLPLWSP
jgi:hypothetical protein